MKYYTKAVRGLPQQSKKTHTRDATGVASKGRTPSTSSPLTGCLMTVVSLATASGLACALITTHMKSDTHDKVGWYR